MSGSTYGKFFTVTTWGESHGKALGVVVDGCPAGVHITEEYIQRELNKRRPQDPLISTPRTEPDRVEVLSGIMNDITTGTPISLIIYNTSAKSADYEYLKEIYRPGHADYPYEIKYGIRDYRGGGRSSGRETIARVAAGAIAKKILQSIEINIFAYTISIGDIKINPSAFNKEEICKNPMYMPDKDAAYKAHKLVSNLRKRGDSIGGIVECRVNGLPVGIGEPVFDKLDAKLAQAMLSIGAAKGIEIGSGFGAAQMTGSYNNDPYILDDNTTFGIKKSSNNAGGILGGMSDGSEIVFRVAFKPTPSISTLQTTVNTHGEKTSVNIKGRHDACIVPRAVIVVESMAAITIVDLLFQSILSKMETIKKALIKTK